jgi:hypothetical protein
MKTSELQGAALDWAVARCEVTEHIEEFDYFFLKNRANGFCYYSMNWALGGPIIEREKLTVAPSDQKSYVEQEAWTSYRIKTLFTDQGDIDYQTGPTPLIAAMRCYVASKLGDTVEIPEELK